MNQKRSSEKSDATGCSNCQGGEGLGFEISMAFQPIVDLETGGIFAQEALVRGPGGEPAAEVFRRVNEQNRYPFDQACRVKAIEWAARLEIPDYLSINFMPNAVYRPELCIRTTLAAAKQFGFPVDRIIFEITEGEKVEDHEHLQSIVQHYQKLGFLTAIDDFGAGYAGLNLLAEFATDLVKLDMGLIRNIDSHPVRQVIVSGIIDVCRQLGIRVIAEGVETAEELAVVRSLGVSLVQGYYFARPAFQSLAEPENL